MKCKLISLGSPQVLSDTQVNRYKKIYFPAPPLSNPSEVVEVLNVFTQVEQLLFLSLEGVDRELQVDEGRSIVSQLFDVNGIKQTVHNSAQNDSYDRSFNYSRNLNLTAKSGDLYQADASEGSLVPTVTVLRSPGWGIGGLTKEAQFYPHVVSNKAVGDLLVIKNTALPLARFPHSSFGLSQVLLNDDLLPVGKIQSSIFPGLQNFRMIWDGWIVFQKTDHIEHDDLVEVWKQDKINN